MERIVYKRVIVAGGCGGIGREVVAALRTAGAEVAVLDQGSSIERFPVPAGTKAVALDASREDSVASAFKALNWKETSGFVNLVGFTPPLQGVEAMAASTWDDVVAGNLRAAFLLSRAVIPLLKASGDGAVV